MGSSWRFALSALSSPPSRLKACNGPSPPAVLLPADQPAGVPEDLLGEQDRSPGEGDSRGGTEVGGVEACAVWPGSSSLFVSADQQHEGQVQGDAGALRQPGAETGRNIQGEAEFGEEVGFTSGTF